LPRRLSSLASAGLRLYYRLFYHLSN
jgi:hypothetical protein